MMRARPFYRKVAAIFETRAIMTHGPTLALREPPGRSARPAHVLEHRVQRQYRAYLRQKLGPDFGQVGSSLTRILILTTQA